MLPLILAAAAAGFSLLRGKTRKNPGRRLSRHRRVKRKNPDKQMHRVSGYAYTGHKTYWRKEVTYSAARMTLEQAKARVLAALRKRHPHAIGYRIIAAHTYSASLQKNPVREEDLSPKARAAWRAWMTAANKPGPRGSETYSAFTKRQARIASLRARFERLQSEAKTNPKKKRHSTRKAKR